MYDSLSDALNDDNALCIYAEEKYEQIMRGAKLTEEVRVGHLLESLNRKRRFRTLFPLTAFFM